MSFLYENNVGPIYGTLKNSSISFAWTGYTLIYSNAPETLFSTDLADSGKYLYADQSNGRTRAFFHHANDSASDTYRIRIELVNPNSESVNLFVSNNGWVAHNDFSRAGAMAWINWLTQSPGAGAPAGTDAYVRTIGANSSDYYIVQEAVMGPLQAASGIVDFVAVGTSSGSVRPIKVKVYAYKNAPSNSPTTPAPIRVTYQDLPNDTTKFGVYAGTRVYYGTPGFEDVVRGTFANCSRTANISYNSSSGAQYIEMFKRHTHANVISGEFQAGYDATIPVGQNRTVYTPYGVDFTLNYNIIDGARKPIYGYLQNMEGSDWHVLREDGQQDYASLSSTEAWNFDITTLNGGSKTTKLWTTCPGGLGGTQQIFWA
ncbi:hypothetical protein LJK88_06480 [Paenibacillus sp. P26]|nr:hypothetical protein LJK88_06480 [Paenibacillus sp. P26]UUZ90357.1 hypothetical protein LJK87_31045 [Paenibacillus sp. P25]